MNEMAGLYYARYKNSPLCFVCFWFPVSGVLVGCVATVKTTHIVWRLHYLSHL